MRNQKSLKWLVALASVIALLMSLPSCSSSNEVGFGGAVSEEAEAASTPSSSATDEPNQPTSSQVTESDLGSLPEVAVSADEGGPSDLSGMVSEALLVARVELVDVEPGVRYYGRSYEAPDATTFEQVGLVFEIVESFKDDLNSDSQIVIPWTAYTAISADAGAERLSAVSYNGMVINESSVGQHYGLFVKRSSDGQLRALTSQGIIPLDADGRILVRSSGNPGAFTHDHIDESFAQLLSG